MTDTDEQINAAIFKANGWVKSTRPGDYRWVRGSEHRMEVPNYTHDWRLCGGLLKEMSEFEKYLCPQCGTMQESLKAELARRDEIIARLKEDGERLEKRAITYVYLEDTPPYYECELCFHDADEPDNILHDKSCPITLHRALMKELE